MGSISRFDWMEVEPGRWERDLDEIENFYLALDQQYAATGRHMFAIMGHVSVTIDVPSNQHLDDFERSSEFALREAWARLRFDHPTIASWVEYDGKQPRKVYETTTSQGGGKRDLEGWLDQTFCPVDTEQTGLDWCNSDPPVPHLPTMFILKTIEPLENGVERAAFRRDLVFRAPHNIIDGIGTLMLFDNFLKHASEIYSSNTPHTIPWGEEHKNLSPSFRIAASLPDAITPQQFDRLEHIVSSNADLKREFPVLSIPFKNDQAVPGKHQRLSIKISVSQTASILAACRARSLSVTHAYHTAIAMAVRDAQPSSQTSSLERYINYCLVNERAHCKPPYNTSSHAAAVYHSTSGSHLALDLHTPGPTTRTPATDKTDFAHLAPIVKNYYTSVRTNTSHPPLVPHYFSIATPKDPRITDSTPSNPAPLPPNNETPSVSISSMGRVDDLITPQRGTFSMHDAWVTGEELGTGLGAFLGTFRGEMTFSVAYNEAFHGKEEIEKFSKRVQEIVVCVLDV